MAEFWYGVLALMLIAYTVLDGFDFGAGLAQPFIAKSDAERRAVIAAIGPYWDGNEVWLLAAGGVLFVAFPTLLATAFPAFYLAFFLVLWSLILRGISIEVRSHVADGMWRTLWDTVFAGSSAVLALLFGVALGNVIRGVPLPADRHFTMPFFTDFTPISNVGLLDYYTVSVGLFSLSFLAAHGATFLVARTTGELRERAWRFAGRAWWVVLALFPLVTLETWQVRPDLLASLVTRPLGLAFALLAAAAGVAVRIGRRRDRDGVAFLGSSAAIKGLLGALATALYPTLLCSTLDARYSLTVPEVISPAYSLEVTLIWWPVAFVLALSYFAFVFRANRVRVSVDEAQE